MKLPVIVFAILALTISISVLFVQLGVVHAGDFRVDYIEDAIRFIFDPSITFYDEVHCPLSQICN